MLPSNRTGENPNWDNQDNIVYYDDFFTIWDTFRTLNPLINIINPTRGAEIVQSLANTYKNDGYAPDARSANQNGRVQGGTNSDIVIADAYVKNVANNVDWKLAYASMVKMLKLLHHTGMTCIHQLIPPSKVAVPYQTG